MRLLCKLVAGRRQNRILIAVWVQGMYLFSLSLILTMLAPAQGLAAVCEQGFEAVPVADQIALLVTDDGPRPELVAAIGRSLAALHAAGPKSWEKWEGGVFPRVRLTETLAHFQRVLRENPGQASLSAAIKRDFALYRACGEDSGRGAGRVLVTGYYEPELAGSVARGPDYGYPLYRRPSDLEEGWSDAAGRRRVWQRRGFLYRYPSRSMIEEKWLLAGNELAWLADPVDGFILQVQGSGRIRLPDGSVRRVRYDGNNGLSYTSIGRLLVNEGRLSLEEADMPGILRYLREHPEEQQRLFHQNDRYIFFDWNHAPAADGPPGSLGASLAAGRSVALDPASYPPGAIGFLDTTRPRFDRDGNLFSWVGLRRLVLSQDAGAAIKGPGRVDFFWGSGPYARRAAGVMRQPGCFFLLLKKDGVSSAP